VLECYKSFFYLHLIPWSSEPVFYSCLFIPQSNSSSLFFLLGNIYLSPWLSDDTNQKLLLDTDIDNLLAVSLDRL
jgi:hypothetical protein